jgi:hypothetical protein
MANRLKVSDPVYTEAMMIKASLVKAGLKVECVLPSKAASILQHQTGAALFRTKEGDFEALVLEKPYKFDALEIREEQRGSGWYSYSWRGDPAPPSGGGWGESNRKWYFVKSQNRMFIMDNEKLAAKLEGIFAVS